MSALVALITSPDPEVRNRALDDACAALTARELLAECDALENFRSRSQSLYERVRAQFFLSAIHRYHLAPRLERERVRGAAIPFDGYAHLLERRFEEALAEFRRAQAGAGPSAAISSALAAAYQRLGFQTLANQVRRSVRSVRGNQWMFRMGHPLDHPLRVRRELLPPAACLHSDDVRLAPILRERTPVRMDLSHSGWSDIFFLGMDFPEGARVLNISVDLGVHGRDAAPRPPVEAYVRVIDEPVLRLTSVDLGATADLVELSEVFDFARDYLGLLKAAVIAAGIVPPGLEGSGARLGDVLARLVGPGLGLELVSNVNDIPKGSRLAVSTTLLGALISALMRATGQASSLTGPLSEHERRMVAARAILGEWLGGSGGGWQDSGGLWPGMKRIEGVLAAQGDPEFGISRGRLLPNHFLMKDEDGRRKAEGGRWKDEDGRRKDEGGRRKDEDGRRKDEGGGMKSETGVHPSSFIPHPSSFIPHPSSLIPHPSSFILHPSSFTDQLQDSLVLVHGGMAQNVGPILEMVTEKYLLRSANEWRARRDAMGIYDQIVACVGDGENAARQLAALTTRNFEGPLQAIIPWASNHYTETLIERARADFGADFWGFLMLGGMSGGGMGFFVAPQQLARAKIALGDIMAQTKRELDSALPFAMQPVVYDFAVNANGTYADLLDGDDAPLPQGYYALIAPALLRQPLETLTEPRRAELDRLGAASRTRPELSDMTALLFDRLFPRAAHASTDDATRTLPKLLEENGFDRATHERIRADLRAGRIGLAQNRLSPNTRIEDVRDGDVLLAAIHADDATRRLGEAALKRGEVAVFTLAAGAGSRWTQGAGVVKALHPFCRLSGRHRSFIELHLAKTRRVMRDFGSAIPHVIATSYLSHDAIAATLMRQPELAADVPVHLSPGRAIGQRLIPMARDLRFAYEESPQQLLDTQAQKVRESLHAALIQWARNAGEGSDYTDNAPTQCIHPVGHWFELPNMLRNGVLARVLDAHPSLRYIMLHNVDTVGADVDAAVLGLHIRSGARLTFEVVERQMDDRGGGLARVDGALRIVEGLAMPREEDEFRLSFYSSNTTWIDIEGLLELFGLTRPDLVDQRRVDEAVSAMAARMPTYITLKDVKKRWGHGQEDVFPVTQFEKLWGDMTALPEARCAYVGVPRARGQQLKDIAQLDGWVRDGSAAYVNGLCAWR